MHLLRFNCLALVAGVAAIAPTIASASQDQVDATATVMVSQSISSETAIRVLLNQSTGVMTIAIPGTFNNANGNSSAIFSFNGVAPIDRGFQISSTGQNRATLDQLMRQLGLADGASRFSAEFVQGNTVSGFIDPNHFQLIVLEVVKSADGSGYLRAIVPFN